MAFLDVAMREQRTQSPVYDFRDEERTSASQFPPVPHFSDEDVPSAPLDHSSPRYEIGIRIEPVALVTQECITLTSAMRKHARWAQSSVSAILGGSVQPTSLQVPEQTVPRPNSSRGSTPRIDPVGGKSTIGPTVSDDESTLASRWGLRTKKVKPVQDNPLLSAFAKLRRDLANCRDISKFDAPALLHPFLQVIRSSSTSATITSLAVMSITKFLNYNLITIHSPRIAPAMHLLSAAITHCRFEASDTAADEVVLLRILRLMELAISRPEGLLLGDESVCEMMSTGLSMCCQTRLSEVLRRSAEMAMVTMCQIVFGRLAELKIEDPPVQSSGRSRSNTTRSVVPPVDEMKIQPPLMGSVMGNGREPRPSTDNRASYESNQEISGGERQASAEKDAPRQAQIEEDDESTPYALPSIRELFRVLIDLLDPHNRQHTNAMRIMALRILDVALEVAGPFIAAQPTLAVLVEDDLCRHLFQLVRSEDMVLLNSSLRVAGTLLTTCRKLLKLQQELYLSYLIACLHIKVEIPLEPGIDSALYEGVPQAPKLVKPAPSQPSSGRATPVPVKDRRQLGLEGGQRRPEAREAMVEAIGTLIRMPVFMAELFVNYDCDVDRQDLCEDMVGLLARNAFPDAATWSTTNVPPLCLDSLLTFIQFLTDGISQAQPEDAAERIAQLRRQRRRKKIIKSGSTKFNDNPKGGVAFLVSNGIIDNPDDPVQLAKFLKSTTHLSKKVLGDFITKKTNEELLKAFIGLFDFDGKRIDEALRELLTSFRLPGESALIERIVNVFVEKFLNSSISDSIADQDAGFVLTYAIIMLNTDLYNPNVKKSQKRMTVEDFARNLRGVNAGKDFDQDYLQDIYDAINQNEIILPEEHDNKNAFDHAWKTMLLNTQNAGQLELCNTNAFDAEMFSATWKPIVATLCYVFMSATDDAVYSRVVSGFDQCAQLAAKYGVTEAFDRIIYSLSQISGLATEIPLSTSLNTEVQVGKKKVMVSELAVRLGRDYRAQLSTIVLLRSLQGYEIAVGETWVYVVRILRNLFVNALITMPVQSDNMLSDLGPIPLQPPAKVIDKDGKLAETGIFSTFTSYLSSYAADEPPEPSEEELENTLSSVDCVAACRVEDLLTNLLTLPSEQLEKLVNALLSEMPDAPSPVVVVKPDVRPAPVTARVNGTRTAKHGPEYDAGAVFLLELATRLVLRDNDTIATAGEALTNALQSAVRNASNIHPLAASRIVQYLLELLRHSFEHDFMRAPVVLHAISSFNDMLLDQTATAVVKGLTLCVGQPGPLRADAIASPDFWSILQRLHQHKTEADNVLAILEKLTEDSSPTQSSSPTFRGITPDSYTPALTLATSFATAASMPGSIIEQRRDLAHRRGQKPRPPRPEDAAIVQRALKAITVLYALGGLAPQLIKQSALERGEAWKEYWGAIFRGLAGVDGIAMSACREVRNRGVSVLLRILLSDDLVQPEDLNTSEQVESDEVEDADKSKSTTQQGNNEWTAIFSEVLFPLVARLLKPEVHKADPVGMGETRVVMVTVLCKAFLKYFDQLAKIPSRTIESASSTQDGSDTTDEKSSAQQSRTKQEFVLVRAWAGTLELLDRLMNASVGTKEGESLEEAVAESVKNVLLVLGDAGLLVRAGDSDLKVHDDEDEMQAQLWRETKHRVEVLLPGLMEEIFPEPKASSMPLPASAPVPDGAAGDEKGTMA